MRSQKVFTHQRPLLRCRCETNLFFKARQLKGENFTWSGLKEHLYTVLYCSQQGELLPSRVLSFTLCSQEDVVEVNQLVQQPGLKLFASGNCWHNLSTVSCSLEAWLHLVIHRRKSLKAFSWQIDLGTLSCLLFLHVHVQHCQPTDRRFWHYNSQNSSLHGHHCLRLYPRHYSHVLHLSSLYFYPVFIQFPCVVFLCYVSSPYLKNKTLWRMLVFVSDKHQLTNVNSFQG